MFTEQSPVHGVTIVEVWSNMILYDRGRSIDNSILRFESTGLGDSQDLVGFFSANYQYN